MAVCRSRTAVQGNCADKASTTQVPGGSERGSNAGAEGPGVWWEASARRRFGSRTPLDAGGGLRAQSARAKAAQERAHSKAFGFRGRRAPAATVRCPPTATGVFAGRRFTAATIPTIAEFPKTADCGPPRQRRNAALQRRPGVRDAITLKPICIICEIPENHRSPHPPRQRPSAARQGSKTLHTFPKVSRFDHLLTKKPANPFGKSGNSPARHGLARASSPAGGTAGVSFFLVSPHLLAESLPSCVLSNPSSRN
jgi:hypothetical protein